MKQLTPFSENTNHFEAYTLHSLLSNHARLLGKQASLLQHPGKIKTSRLSFEANSELVKNISVDTFSIDLKL